MIEFKVHKLWPWMPMAGITFGKHIFLKDVKDKLTLEHELVHSRQQAEFGWWFWFSYIFFPLPLFWNPWRMKWEAEAYAVQVRAGCKLDEISKIMTGMTYGWCCRQMQAEAAIKRWL
jgi:hypothetical protein